MNSSQARQINEAAREFAGAVRESLRTVSATSAEAQERTQRLMQSFFEAVSTELRAQTEHNRATSQEMVEQSRRQQEAFRQLSEESMEAYRNFLGTMFSYYRGAAQQAERNVEEGARLTSEGAETMASTVEPGRGGRRPVSIPIEDYDALSVAVLTEQLEGLTEEQLRLVREYEASNRNRQTLIEQIDRRTGANS